MTRPSVSTGPAATSPPPPAITLPGRTYGVRLSFDNPTFFVDGGALVATWARSGPSPFLSRVVIAAPPATDWRTVYESDAIFQGSLAAGRMALVEYREQGGGAYSDDVKVLDIATGHVTSVDHFALSAATYHGGGGGPPRPSGRVVLAPTRIAWTRLVEGTGGSVTGELRLATLADPTKSVVVASSEVFLAPIALDDEMLVYEAARGTGLMELRLRDIASGSERVLASGGISEVVGPPFSSLARAGDLIAWSEVTIDARGAMTGQQLRAVNVRDGTRRSMPLGGTCPLLSANARFIAVSCYAPADASGARPSMLLVDARTWTVVSTAAVGPEGPHDLVALGTSELAWQDTVNGDPRVVLWSPQ